MSDESWYKHYHDEGKKLLTDAQQFKQRVIVWKNINMDDPRLPKAEYDYLQAGIKYNLFVQKTGDLIGEVETAIESRLAHDKTLSPTQQHSLNAALQDLNDQRYAWTQVLINDKHKTIDLPIVRYNDRIYHPDRPSEWDSGTWGGVGGLVSESLGKMVDNTQQGARNAWDGTSPETRQAGCKLLTGETLNKLVGEILTTPGGGSGMGREIVKQAWGNAVDQATRPLVNSYCEERFPTNDNLSGARNDQPADLGAPSSRQAENKAIFDQLVVAFGSGDPQQMRQAQQAAYHSEPAQQMFQQGREIVNAQEQQQALEQQQLQEAQRQHVAMAHTRQAHSLHS